MRHPILILIFISIVWIVKAQAEDSFQGITIIGDQELPKVLYIVPWRGSVPPQIEPPEFANESMFALDPCRLRRPLQSGSGPQWSCKRRSIKR
jgi:hypothetical protein